MKQLAALISLPPTGLVLLSIGSTQLGSAFAKSLFPYLSPAGMVTMRVGFAALVLMALWRPRWRSDLRTHLPMLIGFGLSLSLMNFAFYCAIERIPIGVGVALEFIGPLGLAMVNSRRWLDGLWALLAAIGVLLLTPLGGFTLDGLGVMLALTAGGFWALYILMSARTGQALAGGEGLAWAMVIGTCVLLPIGIATDGLTLLDPRLMLAGFVVAILSSVLTYSLELSALRVMPVQVFGVLLSLEPGVAAMIGWVGLGEVLAVRAMIAIALVCIAAGGAARFRPA
ncbi:MAG: EamA family transporter [Cyanobacteria bacterium P01_A01_bin.123]